MQQNKTLFFAIITVAILVVIGMFGVVFFLADSLSLPAVQEKIAIRVVAAPSIKPWLDQAAEAFNQSNADIQVEVIEASSLIPETEFQTGSSQEEPPAAWLAEATFVVEMAGSRDLQFDNLQSVANSSLAWGAFNNRREAFNQKYGSLNWIAIHQNAVEPDSALKLVIASPANSAEGLAALGSAAAAHLDLLTLSRTEVRQAEPWLNETFKESARGSLTLGPQPAEAFATRGASVGEAGLVSLASWRRAGLQNRPDFTITPAEPDVNLDYPFAIWTGSRITPEAQQAAAAFRDFLLSESQQNLLADHFFERAEAAVPGVKINGEAGLTLLRWAELELIP